LFTIYSISFLIIFGTFFWLSRWFLLLPPFHLHWPFRSLDFAGSSKALS
jgi:hypothetical protein